MSKCVCCNEPLVGNHFGTYCWKCSSGVGWLQCYPWDLDVESETDTGPVDGTEHEQGGVA